MPVASIGQVIVLTHDAVRSPRHGMRKASADLESTARAYVGLGRSSCGKGLLVPQPIPLAYGAPRSDQDTGKIALNFTISPNGPIPDSPTAPDSTAAGAIRTGHPISLSTRRAQPVLCARLSTSRCSLNAPMRHTGSRNGSGCS